MDASVLDPVSLAMLAALASWVALPTWWWWRLRTVAVLGPEAAEPGPCDAVAVVVPARDEAGTPAAVAALEGAARSLVGLDLPDLEVVAVDDRSRDGTVDALARAFAGDPRARVLRGDEPPAGWLGKVHAQASGVAATTAAWVLFTDADVRLHPAAVRAALAYARREDLDHVTLIPRFEARGVVLRAFVSAFALLLTLLVQPWASGDPRSPRAHGIGAFGLYRRAALERLGGLAAVRARPDDDLALARALKAAGGRTAVAFAPRLVAIDWYPSLAAALAGLEKNAFAGVGYRAWVAGVAAVALLATHVAPYAALFAGPPVARAAAVGVLAATLAAYAAHGRRMDHPAWLGLLHPLSATVLVVALVRSTARALVSGGIVWRGRRYPLTELREAQRVAAVRERMAARARARGDLTGTKGHAWSRAPRRAVRR